MKYDDYINSDDWQRLRAQRLIRSGHRCEACGGSPRLLHAHHMDYRNLTDCTVEDLITLCEICHRAVHLELKHRGLQSRHLNRRDTIALVRASKIPPKVGRKSNRRMNRVWNHHRTHGRKARKELKRLARKERRRKREELEKRIHPVVASPEFQPTPTRLKFLNLILEFPVKKDSK